MNGKPVTGATLSAAFGALIKGDRAINNAEPSMGCSIKWKR